MTRSPFLALTLAALLTAASARADEITFETSLPFAESNWARPVRIPSFPTHLGQLQEVRAGLEIHAEGAASFENLGSATAGVATTFATRVTLEGPQGTTLLTSAPAIGAEAFVDAFDGTVDMDGSSGRTYSNLVLDHEAEASVPQALTETFTGGGAPQLLEVRVEDETRFDSANGLMTRNKQYVGVRVSVTYRYSPTRAGRSGD